MKSFQTVLLEAIVVGALLIVVYVSLEFVLRSYQMHPYVLLFLSGALFHLICEYTGVNLWYVREYNKILVR